MIEAFQAEEVGFLLPPVSTKLDGGTMVDISHESLFHQWHLFREWLNEEAGDATELKKWQQRATRQKTGGGWLDEYDCERAQRWLVRLNERGNPAQWATRYGGLGYAEIDEYIEKSVERVKHAKAEQVRLEREAKAEQTRWLKLEAQLQREAAERADAERLKAERDKQQAQTYAMQSRGKTRITLVGVVVAVTCFLIASGAAWYAYQLKSDAEKVARDAVTGELAAKAESHFKDSPDQSSLLALAAWRISPIAKPQALIRAAVSEYSGQTVLRGHTGGVGSAQFAPDGKTIATGSDDQTARLWRCEVCRPIDELAVQLQKAIGRDLTDDERRRFGVPDRVPASK